MSVNSCQELLSLPAAGDRKARNRVPAPQHVNLLRKSFALVLPPETNNYRGRNLQAGEKITIRMQDAATTSTITNKKENGADNTDL